MIKCFFKTVAVSALFTSVSCAYGVFSSENNTSTQLSTLSSGTLRVYCIEAHTILRRLTLTHVCERIKEDEMFAKNFFDGAAETPFSEEQPKEKRSFLFADR